MKQLEQKKRKRDNIAMNGIKISVKIKNKDCLNIEKNILKWEKTVQNN